jgi:chromate reductase, NAD(P)H dehydrogenase (quinone)
MINVLAISGSLRTGSTNTALLHAAQLLQPDDIAVTFWTGVGLLPHFTPDLEDNVPATAQELRELVGLNDALLIACPEYARGIPGAFKNTLDWLVGGETFINKKIALWNASPRASAAQAALRLVLETMSGQIVEDACIALPLINQKVTGESIAADAVTAGKIDTALRRLAKAVTADRLSVS